MGFPIINDDRYGGKFWGNFIVKNKYPEIWNNPEIISFCYKEAFYWNKISQYLETLLEENQE